MVCVVKKTSSPKPFFSDEIDEKGATKADRAS
jgi:hypothetical protein